jgi:hypothetical protein
MAQVYGWPGVVAASAGSAWVPAGSAPIIPGTAWIGAIAPGSLLVLARR